MFESKEFAAFASKSLVLVEVDFPMKKKQSMEVKRRNAELEQLYKVEGYPQLVILDSEGKELGQIDGYDGKGPKGLIEKIAKLKK